MRNAAGRKCKAAGWDAPRWEFLRYFLVGGTAFLVDYGVFCLSVALLPRGAGPAAVYASTAAGFAAGLVYSYALSVTFVFRSARERGKGRSARAFALFALIGAAGLLLSEAGMYLVYGLAGVHSMIARALVAAVVLVWNYGARKLLVFR